ncbi:MAG: DUF255 domain-containing protein [Saprospiraceae bacterium]|nr:DUF255 domain-containing protein [Saprospiraceae bacterium]
MNAKKLFCFLSLVTFLSLCTTAVFADNPPKDKINWLTWEEAVQLDNPDGKKYFVDLYTEWCGYCKKMDRETFQDPKVIQYINENFIPIKLDAEQKANIEYKGHTLKHNPKVGRRGMHELAMALLEGVERIGYPSYVYLDKDQNRITISPGYKSVRDMLMELEFIAGGHYESTPFQDFAKDYQ